MSERIGAAMVILVLVVAAGLLLMGITKVQRAAARMACQNNMKQIGIGLLNYYDTYTSFPAGTVPNDELPRRGLGYLVSALVVQRFLVAGYTSIRVAVQEHRVPAIKTYLKAGFLPFIHQEDLLARWQRVCEQVSLPFTPEQWPKTATHWVCWEVSLLRLF
jgi:hypothetical protein